MIELKPLQEQVKNLVEDLRVQVAADEALRGKLKKEYAEAKAADRIGATFETWLDDVLDLAAVAWVLGCVFVRFCEDNGLIDKVWIGGPDEAAPVERATQARQAYGVANPLHNDRHWLQEAFGYMRGLRATEKIFDGHSPIWTFDISGDAAETLFDFFRRGDGFRSLRTQDLDTRFLGDLYQDLSAHARTTYALLQTPEFVEEFILDRTFEPAVADFGVKATSVIDPTCGSGHFLLGAFNRLLAKWRQREPATPIDTLVERALGQVTGVDINPFAVAIARFRLVVAALQATGRGNLNNSYPVRVATGDSLLGWGAQSRHQGDLIAELEGGPTFAYFTEDGDLLANYLASGQYTVVVGNPPYITVKDRVLNMRYRLDYSACSGQYAMTVPFAQRFFGLAKRGDHDGDGAGYVGQITANSFMKREFGKKLINSFFAGEVELDEVIDTSGAYIPGHGTPTVILVGKNRSVSRRYSQRIRTVLGIRGEPGTPPVPAEGVVWTAIVRQIDFEGSESEWVSVADFNRDQLAHYPWSLTGGGAAELLEELNGSVSRLSALISDTGRTTHTGLDEAFYIPKTAARTRGLEDACVPMVLGEDVRDYALTAPTWTLFPYDSDGAPRSPSQAEEHFYWRTRTNLQRRVDFGQTPAERGLRWFDHSMFFPNRFRTPLSIAFAGIGTHNHFVLDRGGKVFSRWAPVIKLPEGATEDDHLRLLGVLNSSTACFWLKQVSHNKGSTVDQHGARQTTVAWENFYEFTGTKLQEFPLPAAYPLELGRTLDSLARRLSSLSPAAIAASGVPTRARLAEARRDYDATRARMIALQEELDWRAYQLYGLLDTDLMADTPPELALGERAFEIVLARSMKDGDTETQWFARHRSTPITELPAHWPDDYRDLVERRIERIESDRNIALIERPECKRRWATDGWDAMQGNALRDWLLDRLEVPELWGGGMPVPLSIAQIADRIRHDKDFRAVLDLWVGSDQHDPVKTLGKLVADEHVPYLPADRYKKDGLRKRAQWERTWALQRQEDAGKKVEIAVPPKYTSADFAKPSYWRNRGKLDVPKERFISYPRAGRTGDTSELLGWAGWDHLAQARALATVYLDRKTQEGWQADRLLPLLAGIAELEPWLKQWYDEPQPGFPDGAASFFRGLIDTEVAALGTDRAALTKIRSVEVLS